MQIKQLIKDLEDLKSPNKEIYISRDSEGNAYHPIYGVITTPISYEDDGITPKETGVVIFPTDEDILLDN